MQNTQETCQFKLNDIVYHRMESEKNKGMITAICIRITGITYEVTWNSTQCFWHSQAELTDEYLPDFNSIETTEEKE